MIWDIFKFLVGFSVCTFYKRLQIKNAGYVKAKGPVIIAMNHPNAFMDPVAFSVCAYPPKFMYLARGDVFKPGLASMMLESLGIVPIFRIQDGGKEGLKKNDDTYRRVNYSLKKGRKIMIFAEGLCIQERRLRPLKKGVPRMVFGAMKEIDNPDLLIVPVGVNYSNPKNFRSNLFFNVGEPIRVADYMADYQQAPAKTMNKLLQDLEPKMRGLIVHINDPASDKVVGEVEEIYKRDWCKAEGLNYKNLDHDLTITKKLVAVINTAAETAPEKLDALKQKANDYTKKIKQLKLRDWLLSPAHSKEINGGMLALRCLLLVLGFPIYLLGVACNYPAYALSYRITNKIVKHVEFHSSFNMGIGSFLLMIYYLLQFFVAYAMAPHIGWPFLHIIIAIFSGWFCLYYSPFRKKTLGIYRVLQLRKLDPQGLSALQLQRAEIISLFKSLPGF